MPQPTLRHLAHTRTTRRKAPHHVAGRRSVRAWPRSEWASRRSTPICAHTQRRRAARQSRSHPPKRRWTGHAATAAEPRRSPLRAYSWAPIHKTYLCPNARPADRNARPPTDDATQAPPRSIRPGALLWPMQPAFVGIHAPLRHLPSPPMWRSPPAATPTTTASAVGEAQSRRGLPLPAQIRRPAGVSPTAAPQTGGTPATHANTGLFARAARQSKPSLYPRG